MFDFFGDLFGPSSYKNSSQLKDLVVPKDLDMWGYSSAEITTPPRASFIRLNQDAQVMIHAVDLIFKGCSAKDLPYEPGCKMHNLIMWGFVDAMEEKYGKDSDLVHQAESCKTIQEAITLVEVLKL